ncbi:MAG: phosphoribosylformylglycinamidine cyclo-ligase [Deltaproteobacteria bacterium]|nr:phosphoribosylformylglycinamidine cyclo-ligase [Deltaproteobacteria bacterium]
MPASYAEAGVDIAAGAQLVSRIGKLVRATQGPEVVAGVGGFASLYRLPGDEGSLLVASCDGVGTKLKLAFLTGRHGTVGIDLVAMNVNDLICTGARPLFFLDYFATGKLEVAVAEEVIAGIAKGCRQARCALVGGETAEMPGFYPAGEYDLAGFAVGLTDEGAVLDGSRVQLGDVVIGLPASGLHSNGYSLARRVLIDDDTDLMAPVPELGRSLGDELLEPTHIYVDDVTRLKAAVDVRALVHVTGGGLIENPPRVLPESMAWRFNPSRWEVPAVMQLIAERGRVPVDEMLRTFNMGLGMLAVVPAASADEALVALKGMDAKAVGEIVARQEQGVEFTDKEMLLSTSNAG